ncbi:MAG: phosphatidylinositol-specific phospholipase C domain-containing protein [Gammaproteobacteria bacterium]|nr:phosphatidylinositol-specific phospholipase C domain-containing protein [Gammaproteobacteria bacterium]
MFLRKLSLTLSLTLSLSAFADNTNWMSQIPDSRIMNQLIIPGTHDSGTYAITSFSKFSLSPDDPLPIWIEEISNILPVSLVRAVVSGWSKTQPYSVFDQLNGGIRYLDLRVDLDQDGHFYLNHALLSARLYDVLEQIKAFAQAHPSEIIFVDINHIFNVNNAADETQLVQLIQSYLGENTVPNTYQTNDTIGAIRASNRNVIIFMDTSQTVSSPVLAQFAAHYFWHESNINSPWPNVTNVTDLKNALDTEMAFRAKTYTNNNQFFVLQMIQTEAANEIIDGILNPTHYPNNIQTYETSLDTLLGSWINHYINLYTPKPMNIIIQDWFTNQSDLVPLAIQYDTQRVSAPIKDQSVGGKLLELKRWYAKSINTASSPSE